MSLLTFSDWLIVTAWLAAAVYACWLARGILSDRLLRCPVTGTVALVGVRPAARRGPGEAVFEVDRCALWPDRQDCDRSCLVRCTESGPAFSVDLQALRPFDDS